MHKKDGSAYQANMGTAVWDGAIPDKLMILLPANPKIKSVLVQLVIVR